MRADRAGIRTVYSPLALDKEHYRVIRRLWRHGPQSRIQLAQRLGLSPAAMTKIGRHLLQLGVVEEAGSEQPQARGRPSVPLRVAAAAGYSIGVTLHKGSLDIALTDFVGTRVAALQEPFDDPDPARFARVLRRRVHDLTERHQLLGKRMLGVGLAVPGPVTSPDADRWYTVDTLAQWRDVPLRQMMMDALALPVWIENDANAATLAEYFLGGLGERCATAVVILPGFGIGAGVIESRRMLRGAFGNAGEIGCLYPGDAPRPSTLDLLETLARAGCDVTAVRDLEQLDPRFEHVVVQWATRAAQQLELVINGAIAWLDPGEIMLSGPLPRRVLGQLAQRLNDADLIRGAHREAPPRVSVSNLGAGATTLGAALLPIIAAAQIFDDPADAAG